MPHYFQRRLLEGERPVFHDPLHLIEREQRLLRALDQLIADDRSQREQLGAQATQAGPAAEKSYAMRRASLETDRDAELAALERRTADSKRSAQEECQRALEEAERAYQQQMEEVTHRVQTVRRQAEAAQQEQRFEATALYESAKLGLKSKMGDVERETSGLSSNLDGRLEAARQWLKRYGVAEPAADPAAPPPVLPPGQPLNDVLRGALQAADAHTQRLANLWLPKQVSVWGLAVLLVVYGALLAAPGIWWLRLEATFLAIVSVGGAAALSLSTWLLMRSIAAGQALAQFQPICANLQLAAQAGQRWREGALRSYRRERQELRKKLRTELALFDRDFQRQDADLAGQAPAELQHAAEAHDRAVREATRRRDLEVRRLENDQGRRREELLTDFDRARREAQATFEAERQQFQRRQQETQRQMVERWTAGVAAMAEEVNQVRSVAETLYPSWSSPEWESWRPATDLPACLRLGEFRVRHEPAGALASGLGNGSHAPGNGRSAGVDWSLPALVEFPQHASVLLRAGGAVREQAIGAVQALMLRLLTTIPPGRIRFTIIDPLGLGESFAAFMHLADHDAAIVGGRIWTETEQIERRLSELTEEMEMVIQSCLRNEFATLEEYNAVVGQVAQPYRYLVVANFPANFSEAAVKRLNRIASAGARCGVHLLLTADPAQPLPREAALAELYGRCVQLACEGNVWRQVDGALPTLPLTLDAPPESGRFTRLVKRIGELSVGARRVEVPFDAIAPPAGQWGQGDSRRGIDIPLGVAGTRRQFLRLGQGTSQHGLVAGRTGSGKSTLLHALITNLALHYGPDELELYLIDFKKGVEFKTYAAHDLPQARVVAVESDREFGLSVLERLDAELRDRGQTFRNAGVQDIAAFRAAQPSARMPRALLVIDEFQEFFVEDDRVAQDAMLLLDRLVRQGRAFGVHVLLGSQTLGGAYSLARSTLGQMAVRIALQCSENDAHLILSEENSAARLLSRPGEAIYNDANGQTGGNQPFQVVWLGDARRDELLEQLHAHWQSHGYRRRQPLVVFEGHMPAALEHNPLLLGRLGGAKIADEAWQPTRLWLGDPVAIRETLAIDLARQGGQNVLVAGRNEEAALGIAAAAALSVLAHRAPQAGSETGRGRVLLLDGAPLGAAHAEVLAPLATLFPADVRRAGPKDAAALLAEAAEEIARRQAASAPHAPTWLVAIHDLQRFRDLRRSDDDFSFNRRGDQPATAAEQLATLLRDGPLVGVHVLVWADSWTNLQRSLDRAALREFDLRVLLQMSATDSSNLIDSPAASRLGPSRALLCREDLATQEKFRPYAAPGADVWRAVSQRVHRGC